VRDDSVSLSSLSPPLSVVAFIAQVTHTLDDLASHCGLCEQSPPHTPNNSLESIRHALMGKMLSDTESAASGSNNASEKTSIQKG